MKERYAMLTVDTEALPNRAECDHVNRLILGKHGANRAGVMEMAKISAEFNASMVFFIDLCATFPDYIGLMEIFSQLISHGQDVQLHFHPEYLVNTYWKVSKLAPQPKYLNEYSQSRAHEMLRGFTSLFEKICGKKPTAFRAGSFRWNAGTLKALKELGFTFSFNNSMCAYHNGQCPFSLPTNEPFLWSNGLIEIPVTEHQIMPAIQPAWWARLQYPPSKFFRYRHHFKFLPGTVKDDARLLVFLLHSWSFLDRDRNGYEVYRDDGGIVRFRKLMKDLVRDYDIINTEDLKYLIDTGKIKPTHVENIENAAIEEAV